MKKYIAIFSVALLAVFSASCTKEFENVQNTSRLTGTEAAEMVEQDPSFLSSYINGLYSWMVAFNTVGSSSGPHDDFGHLSIGMIGDLMGQDIAIAGSWNWGTYDINHDYGQSNWTRPLQFWNFYYTLIKQCNDIIDFFPADQDPVNATLRGYLGQAYALRAMSYYYLIQLFQDPAKGDYPSPAFNAEAPGVPLVFAARDGKTTEEVAALSGRNTLQIVCDQIELDLAAALPLLEGYKRPTKNEVDYNVAQGIAARYYLLTQQWNKAITAAKAAQTGYDIMDRERLYSGFMEIEDKEVLWGFNHTAETQTTYASFFSHMGNDCYGYGGIGQSVRTIDASLYNAIPDSDWRKGLFNTPAGDPTAPYTGGKMPYANRKFGVMDGYLQDYLFMRNAEMVLIEAEAHARLSDGQAASTLATLMAKRNPSWTSNGSLEEVLFQRRVELWGEGFEYFDLRRNAKGVNRKYEGSNHSTNAQYEFKAHAKSWNFQIPLREMQNNIYITDEEQNEWITGTEEE